MTYSAPSEVPRRFVDLHSHLVPAVDDGVESVQEALDSLAALADEGAEGVVTTPHLLVPHLTGHAALQDSLDRQRRGFARVVHAVEHAPDLPWVALGQEILAPDAPAARRALALQGLGLGNERYLLIEFGFALRGRPLDAIDAVLEAGRVPVVAHPERYFFDSAAAGLEAAQAWSERGARLQINAGSFGGYYAHSSPLAAELSWAYVRDGLASIVASDHHGIRRQGVSLDDAWSALVSRGAGAEAELLLGENPRRIRLGQDVAPVPAVAVAMRV
jgi:protein-tyrosine phosphatase